MKMKLIGLAGAVIAAWMIMMAVDIVRSFDYVAENNREMTEVEWTFLSDSYYGEYEDIREIEGSRYFIGVAQGEAEYDLIDEKGEFVEGPFTYMEPIGGGFVRTENTPSGAIIYDESGENVRTRSGVIDGDGAVLSEEAETEVLEEYDANGKITGGTQQEYAKTHKVMKYGRILGIAKQDGR